MKPVKLLYGTGNPAKLDAMRRRLKNVNIEIAGLSDMDRPAPHVDENGASPLENAVAKAKAYYAAFGVPVFSCDSGLYFDGVPPEDQPGVHVRTVGGRYLTDEEMIGHYSALARKYGNLTARYRNAICLVLDSQRICSSMDDSLASEPFIITHTPHAVVREGFPLDSLSIDIATGMYYYDLDRDRLDSVAVEVGFPAFFNNIFGEQK